MRTAELGGRNGAGVAGAFLPATIFIGNEQANACGHAHLYLHLRHLHCLNIRLWLRDTWAGMGDGAEDGGHVLPGVDHRAGGDMPTASLPISDLDPWR